MSLYRCHIQENLSVDADPNKFLTRTKLEDDQHFTLHLLFLPDPVLIIETDEYVSYSVKPVFE